MARASFHYPDSSPFCYGRSLALVACDSGTLYAATRFEQGADSGIVLVRKTLDGISHIQHRSDAHCHQPCIAADGNGTVAVVWNEVHDGRWRVRCAQLPAGSQVLGEPQTVFSSERLCLPPSAVFAGDELVVAWPAVTDGSVRIHVASGKQGVWTASTPVSGAADAFRPCLAAGAGQLWLTWDEYVDGTYRVAFAQWQSGRWQCTGTAGQGGERWFCPRTSIAPDGTVYFTWAVLQEVSDDRGIAEHVPFAMFAKATVGQDVDIVRDPANADNDRMVGDCREGLLASETYLGYHGLRRNPWVSVSDSGQVWLLWEVRFEHEKDHLAGHLMGRQIHQDGTLSTPVVLHDNGYAYAVPPAFSGTPVPAVFFCDRDPDPAAETLQFAMLDCAAGRPHVFESARWQRWEARPVQPQSGSDRALAVGDRTWRMFWADTHCHGVFSPDAEGETDELIHFARDVAHIDAICVIDNDFYPHKVLSEAEWQTHGEFARHFTEDGKFVVFPGWEYTYHRKDLTPDFNHRCVIYPRPGGRLWRRLDPEACTDSGLFAELKGTEAMCYPHHCTYKIIDPELDWNVEIVSSWRVCMEETDFTMRQLKQGQRFGFIGSSDSHRSVPGLGGALTGLYADELTPEALFDAYRNRRTIATQGFKIFVDFRAGGLFIGAEGQVSGPPEITAEIRALEPIESVEIVRDGKSVHRVTPHGVACEIAWADSAVPNGEHFYFLRIKLEGDPSFNVEPGSSLGAHSSESRYPHNLARARGVYAWTSPVWLRVGRM